MRIEYEESAEAYLRKLPLEHFIEATAQGHQRKITLESLGLVHARRPDVQIFNELLVQYPLRRERTIGKVVPDNMVVLWPEPIKASGSYDLPLQPVGSFWMLEYVSKYNKRKDYEINMRIYEHDLKVPYYLLFYPDAGEMTLYHLRGRKYRSVPPNERGRHPLAELDLEMALLDEWVRYWYKGELLPLPADLQRDLDETRRQLRKMKRRAETERQARLAAEAELRRLREDFEKLRRTK